MKLISLIFLFFVSCFQNNIINKEKNYILEVSFVEKAEIISDNISVLYDGEILSYSKGRLTIPKNIVVEAELNLKFII